MHLSLRGLVIVVWLSTSEQWAGIAAHYAAWSDAGRVEGDTAFTMHAALGMHALRITICSMPASGKAANNNEAFVSS